MADGRILHRSAGDSAKVAALSDFEYRVWTQYLLSADDCGVMVAEAVKLQADNRALRNRPKARVQAALEAVISIGLLATFDHQGQRYVCQFDWQDRQQIRYPRNSVHPVPPPDVLGQCSTETRNHFTKKRKVSAESPQPARAGGRETLTLTLTPTLTGSSEGGVGETVEPDEPLSPIAPVFSHRRSGAAARPGGLVGNHGRCVPCAAEACGRGICVPGFLAQGWLQQFEDRDEGERHISGFVASELARLPDGPVGDDPLHFWRAAWQAVHGTQARSTASTKASRAVAAARRVMGQP